MPGAILAVPGQWFDDEGDPLAGGKLYFYTAGTATEQRPYTTSTISGGGAVPHAQPVVLDAAGRAQIFLDPALAYKIVCKDANDVELWTRDNIRIADPTAT